MNAPLSNKTLDLLKQKHPEPKESSPEIFLQGPFRPIQPVAHDDIKESLVMRAAMLTKGDSGPAGLDANGWRMILTSRQFANSSSDLRKAFANFIKKLCSEEQYTQSLETFTANRLIPLDKNPGLRQVGLGEVLTRIAGKVVMILCKKDFTKAAGSLQLSAGQDADAEAAIHAMRDIFADVDTHAVLLVDAENTLNSKNRKVMLHNLKFICPIIATYIINCYATPSRLFIVGGGEILSSEGITQDDPTAMGVYALGILPLIKFLLEFINLNEMNAKEVAFADDFSVVGSLNSIKDYWDKLTATGAKYGYFPKPTKSYLIVKEKKMMEAQNLFSNSRVNIQLKEKE